MKKRAVRLGLLVIAMFQLHQVTCPRCVYSGSDWPVIDTLSVIVCSASAH